MFVKTSPRNNIINRAIFFCLSYETIWNEGKRTVTLKRARGPAEDKKDLPADEYHTSKQTRNKNATKQHGQSYEGNLFYVTEGFQKYFQAVYEEKSLLILYIPEECSVETGYLHLL